MKIKFDFNKIIGYFNLNSERGLFINSLRDWKVLLVCSALFLVLVFSVDAYILLIVRDKMNLAVQGAKSSKELKIDEAALDGVLREIDLKAENFGKNYSAYVAPTSSTTTLAI